MLELCRFLEGNIKALDNVKGICFLKENKPFRTSPREAIQDLDSLPFPARDLVDLTLYRPHTFNFRKGKTATIITSRGLSFYVYFLCVKAYLGRKVSR